jgi:uncharacterized protein (DUF1330 family)
MAKGYAIFTEDITDADAMGAYAQAAVQTVIAAGGVPIVVGSADDILEGAWHGNQTVIIEFESVEAARNWYHSPDYQAVIGQRHAAAHSNAIIVGGFEMPSG